MGDKSPIEWLRGPAGDQGATWNPIRARNLATGGIGHFCVHRTEACRNCYAERLQVRFKNAIRYAAQDRDKVDIFLDWETLLQPFRWSRPRLIFVLSMSDLFLEHHCEAWIDLTLCAAALNPQHTFIVLTKRHDRMRQYMAHPDRKRAIAARAMELSDALARAAGNPKARLSLDHFSACFKGAGPLRNIWFGASAHDQGSCAGAWRDLRRVPGARIFLSLEPLLGAIDLTALGTNEQPEVYEAEVVDALRGVERWELDGNPDASRAVSRRLDWVIVGGESGKDARPMHPDWARSLRDQCVAAGVPFFFKQWGEWASHRIGAGGDLGGDVRAGRARIVHRGGESDVEVYEKTGGRSTLPGSVFMERVGKKAAGRTLDGRTWSEFPPCAEASAGTAARGAA